MPSRRAAIALAAPGDLPVAPLALTATAVASPLTPSRLEEVWLDPARTAARFGALRPMPAMGQGFGLGFCVRTKAGWNPLPGSGGDHCRGGAHGTFWLDPAQELCPMLMLQARQSCATLPVRR